LLAGIAENVKKLGKNVPVAKLEKNIPAEKLEKNVPAESGSNAARHAGKPRVLSNEALVELNPLVCRPVKP
jgi:hypothetical protein